MILDPFGLAERVKAGEVQTLRQSNLGSGDICLKRLEYDRDKSIPRGQSQARIAGTAYHAGQALYYETRKGSGLVVPTEGLLKLIYAEVEKATDEATPEGWNEWETSREQVIYTVQRMLYTYFDQEHYWHPSWEVVAVEQSFYWPLWDGWVAYGTPDLVIHHPGDNVTAVVDHKTAKNGWKKNKESVRNTNQPAYYEFFWHLLTGTPLDSMRFVFDIIQPSGKFERRWATPAPHEIRAVLDKAKTLTTLLDKGLELPPNTQHFLCSEKYCDYWQVCPFGAALTDPVGPQPADLTVGLDIPTRRS